MKSKRAKYGPLSDLVWVQYPRYEHAARIILERAARERHVWVLWEVNGFEEEVPLEWVRHEVSGGRSRRRSTRSAEPPKSETKPKKQKRSASSSRRKSAPAKSKPATKVSQTPLISTADFPLDVTQHIDKVEEDENKELRQPLSGFKRNPSPRKKLVAPPFKSNIQPGPYRKRKRKGTVRVDSLYHMIDTAIVDPGRQVNIGDFVYDDNDAYVVTATCYFYNRFNNLPNTVNLQHIKTRMCRSVLAGMCEPGRPDE